MVFKPKRQNPPPPVNTRDIVELLYGNLFTGLIMTVLAMSCLAFGFQSIATQNLKVSFWLTTLVVVVFRLSDAFYWQFRLVGTSYDPTLALRRFSVGAVTTAVIWGAYCILLYPYMSSLELTSTMIILAALAGGAGTALAPSRLLVALYCTCLVLPISAMAMQDTKAEYNIVGFLGIGYWLALLAMSLQSNSFLRRAITIKDQKEDLVRQMKYERNEVARVNAELISANDKLDAANATLEEEVVKRTNDIHRLSNRDPLTSLLNRSGFTRHLENIIKTTQQLQNRLAVLFVDLDGFKQVNDSLGHQVGDLVLEEVAHRLSRFCETDHLARWGSDEFVIVLPYATENTAVAVAHAARSGITIPINVQESQITLDATIGIALYPEHGDSARGLIQEADLTMYEQKRVQRGSVGVFNPGIHEAIKKEQSLREGLFNAISRREFSLVYQPIVKSETNELWSCEALLRWRFGDQNVGPDVFIPLAEKSGLIIDIGNWVLHRACIDASQWPFGDDVSVSVNVSIIQLMDENFVRSLDRALASSGLSPERLHLEITESVFADNKQKVMKQLNGIKARRVQISIDDFGTGFSSLSQLQSLSFDHIKIDRSFVQNMDEGSDTIIRATLLIAHEFGCATVAEGIETPQHANRLTAMGVNCLQGYYCARPMPVRDLLLWHENRAVKTEFT